MTKKTKKAKEKWAVITNFENYAISNYGRIKNLTTGKYLKPLHIKTTKRLIVYLPAPYNEHHQARLRIDLLVAEAFVQKQKGKTEVEPIDGDYENLYFQNLKWVKDKNIGQYRFYRLISATGKNFDFNCKEKIIDFLGLKNNFPFSWQALQQQALKLGFVLKRIEGCISKKVKKKDMTKSQIYRSEILEFANYINEKYPDDDVDLNDPIVIKHYRFIKNWKQ